MRSSASLVLGTSLLLSACSVSPPGDASSGGSGQALVTGGGSGTTGNSGGAAPSGGATGAISTAGGATTGAAGSAPTGANAAGTGATTGSAGAPGGGAGPTTPNVAGMATTAGTDAGGTNSGGSVGASGNVGVGGTSSGEGGAETSGTGGAGVVVPDAAVLTDDFEAATIDAAKWQSQTDQFGGSGSVALSTEQKHGGSQSIKVTGTAGPVMFFNTSVFPVPAGKALHLRFWAWFSVAPWEPHIGFVAAGAGQQDEVRFGGQHGFYQANQMPTDQITPDPWDPACATCTAPVQGAWTCLSGVLDFAQNSLELSVDGTLAVSVEPGGVWRNGSGAALPTAPTQVGFGWFIYNGSPANDVYYDDIALGYEPLPCP